jgi:hypothetical protein
MAVPPVIRKTIKEAKKRGVSVKPSGLANPYQLYLSAKRCQIMRTKPVGRPTTERQYVPLSVPRSAWAEFLIYFVRPHKRATSGDFYVVPRERLSKHTSVSPISSWLPRYAGAWHLLMQNHGELKSYRTSYLLDERERAKRRPRNLNGGRPPNGASKEQLAEWHRDMESRTTFRKLSST